jgi:hypothetical protein
MGAMVTQDGAGVIVRVRVTPRAGTDAIDGTMPTPRGDAVRVKVRSAPDGGAANAAVLRALADWLDVAPSRVTLASGGASRIKLVHVAGSPPDLESRILRQLAESGAKP